MELSLVTNLSVIQLNNNLLSGSVPGPLSSLPSLSTLIISVNSFTGSLGSSVGALVRLRDLQASASPPLLSPFPFPLSPFPVGSLSSWA